MARNNPKTTFNRKAKQLIEEVPPEQPSIITKDLQYELVERLNRVESEHAAVNGSRPSLYRRAKKHGGDRIPVNGALKLFTTKWEMDEYFTRRENFNAGHLRNTEALYNQQPPEWRAWREARKWSIQEAVDRMTGKKR